MILHTIDVKILLSVIIGLSTLIPSAFAAEELYKGIAITPLQSLYAQQLAHPESEYIADQIETKRAVIREILEKNITMSLEAPAEDASATGSEESLSSSIVKQTAVLKTLENFSKEARVDLDLLKKEEKEIYQNAQQEKTDGTFRLTKSHAELLAKTAIINEEISVVSSLTDFHTTRLQKFQFNQRLEQYGLLITLGKYFAIIMIILFVEKTIRKRLLSKITKTEYRYAATKLFTTTVYTFTIIWIAGVTFSKNPSLLASVAIIGAGLAIALQDVVKDLVGGFVIFQHKLFTRGNRISFSDITGEVIDSGLLRTTILEIGARKDGEALERTGKTLSIPNALFLTHPVTNHNASSDYVRAEMKLTITFESNAEKAQQMLQKIVDEETDEYLQRDEQQVRRRMQLYYFRHATRGNQVYMDIAADGVEFTLRFTTPIGERRPVVSRISRIILKQFADENDIDLAYTTQRVLAEIKKT